MQCSWGHPYQLDCLSLDPLWSIGHSDPRINLSTRSFDRKHSFRRQSSSVQDCIDLCTWKKTHMHSTLSLRGFPNIAFKFPCSSDWWRRDTLKVHCLKEAHSPLWWCGWPDCWVMTPVILVWPLVTLSHKISPKSHFDYSEMCITLKIATLADYFGIEKNCWSYGYLKLLSDKYGSHFEKTALKVFVPLSIFSIATGVYS